MQHRFLLISVAIAFVLFLGMLLLFELGRTWGLRQTAKYGAAARIGVGVVDAAIYALLALLLGFTFSGASSRFDQRRDLIVQEVSAISTAWQRVDILPAASQPAIRAGFRRYLDALLASQEKNPDAPGARRASADVTLAQNDIWSKSVAACLAPGGEHAQLLLLPALNEMFDVVDRERLAWRLHPPLVVFAMLFLSALAASLFAGYALSHGPARNWLFIVGFAAMISIVTYVIIEIEFPRVGVVRVNAMDQALAQLRATMN
jgi:hypothetical protein